MAPSTLWPLSAAEVVTTLGKWLQEQEVELQCICGEHEPTVPWFLKELKRNPQIAHDIRIISS
ncbi:MAG: hypothetical protein R3251_00990 [Candidatus Spechtbacterales bacterium]|nr:hypothetical protein [Candidatus Spechtbacterales bacterium]